MKDILIILAPVSTVSASGHKKETFSEVFRCRAYRKKQSMVAGDERAREVFLGQMVVFQTRRYKVITYQCRVKWAECLWEISMIEPRENEMTLTLKKIDQ